MERLQKFIASCGYTSRRKAEELISAGKVEVNGEVVTQLGYKVSSDDVVVVEGNRIRGASKVYYLLNKPRGYICAVSDDLGRKVVTELIDTKERIYPVGRLDYDTTGALILTNDGEFANRMMHPSFNVVKMYMAKIDGVLTMEEYHKLKEGVLIDGVKCKALRLKIRSVDKDKKSSMISISVGVGINHVVKRMFESVGHDVLKLKRESIGNLGIGNLKSGEYRELTWEEVKRIK